MCGDGAAEDRAAEDGVARDGRPYRGCSFAPKATLVRASCDRA
jgi:hypothetical protein